MRVLVFGAGPLGSLFAARLKQGGLDVTLLARGRRLQDLKKHGVVLRNWNTEQEETIKVNLIEKLQPGDVYDLILVVMRKNSALKILPILAANQSKQVLFLMNNAAGPNAFVEALGESRVLVGFPGAAGYRESHKVAYINAEEDQPAGVYIGEPHGGISERLKAVAAIIRRGRFLEPIIHEHMDAWSKCHVALLFPSLAPALYLCYTDNYRMARTRDALVLAWRAIKEGFQVLRKLGYPITPHIFRYFLLIPEPIMVFLLVRVLRNPKMEVAMVRHAEVIRDEVQQLNGEFLELVKESGIFTPTIQFLISQYDQKAPCLAEGSRSIRLDWSGILIPLLVIVLLILAGMLIF